MKVSLMAFNAILGNNMETKVNNICMQALAACPDIVSDEALPKEMHAVANAVAHQSRDYKASAIIRETMENPDKAPEKYKALKNALKCKFLTNVFMTMAQNFESSGVGLFNEVVLGHKFEPMIALPDNQFGSFILDQLKEAYAQLGIVDETFKTQHVKFDPKGQKKIIDSE